MVWKNSPFSATSFPTSSMPLTGSEQIIRPKMVANRCSSSSTIRSCLLLRDTVSTLSVYSLTRSALSSTPSNRRSCAVSRMGVYRAFSM